MSHRGEQLWEPGLNPRIWHRIQFKERIANPLMRRQFAFTGQRIRERHLTPDALIWPLLVDSGLILNLFGSGKNRNLQIGMGDKICL